MKLRKILKRIDAAILKLIGIDGVTRPKQVKVIGDKIIVVSSEANHRLRQENKIEDIISHVTSIEAEERNKFGYAVGKAIASNLIVSFDNPSIKITKAK